MPEQITIIAENRCSPGRALIAEHGFSALIEIEGFTLLFDTGQGYALRQNQALLGYDLGKVDALVLSHGHYDHTGGIAYFLEKNPHAKIYLHRAAFLKRRVKKEIAGRQIDIEVGMTISEREMRDQGAEIIFVDKPAELAGGRVLLACPVPLGHPLETPEEGFYMEQDGEFVQDDFPDDLAVAVRGSRGVSVIFGCAHRGAINTLRLIERTWGVRKLDHVLGGLHLLGRGPEQVKATIDELARFSPERVAVGHCTGDMVFYQVAQAFPGKFVFSAVGARYSLA